MRQKLFFEDRLKDFANDRREADGSEVPWVCCAGGFCDWGNYCAAPTFGDLGSLELNVKHSSKYVGNVGVNCFEDLREKPIRASALTRVKAA